MHEFKLDSPGRRKIKFCPCDKDNRDGKFTPFTGYDKFGHCHGCDKTFFPAKENEFTPPLYEVKHAAPKRKLPISIIPNDLVKANVLRPDDAYLIKWLSCSIRLDRGENPFTSEQVQNVIEKYRIRGSNVYRGGTAFIYIDRLRNVRQIKVMGYNSVTGKRVKEPFPQIQQIGKKIIEGAGVAEINIVACFFGEHLLAGNEFEVYLFESEATAIYASVFFSDKVCMATGGKHGCRWDMPEQFMVLKGRTVTLWPDIDAHDEWMLKAETLQRAGIEVRISEVIVIAAKEQAKIEQTSFDVFKATKFDLRDILIYKEPPNDLSGKEVGENLKKPVLSNNNNFEPPILVQDEVKSFEAVIANISTQPLNAPKKFDTSEYKGWIDTIVKPKTPIWLQPGLTIFDVDSFVTGCLNHINAFTNYREPGKRSLFIYQLQLLRTKLTE